MRGARGPRSSRASAGWGSTRRMRNGSHRTSRTTRYWAGSRGEDNPMVTLRLLFALLALAVGLTASARAPAPFPKKERGPRLPVGQWTVTFTNGVVQTCEVGSDGAARVVERYRNSAGKATVKGGVVMIVCDDDRIERWTRVEGRMVVEHWFPVSAYPAGQPARGIAERAR